MTEYFAYTQAIRMGVMPVSLALAAVAFSPTAARAADPACTFTMDTAAGNPLTALESLSSSPSLASTRGHDADASLDG
jgi:hypothetical protein